MNEENEILNNQADTAADYNEKNLSDFADLQFSSCKKENAEKDNMDTSPFRFYPNTMLRNVFNLKGNDRQRASIIKLVSSMIDGTDANKQGTVGRFEIEVTEWVSKLRYATKDMIMNLINGGYISKGRRKQITDKIITRMNTVYRLILQTNFVTTDDNNHLTEVEGISEQQIYMLGSVGDIMLRELGRKTVGFKAFDILRDGNGVKKYLAANTWLTYWLASYPELIRESYRTAGQLHEIYTYAAVTCNGCAMIAEPVRRVEEFEAESEKENITQRLEAYIDLFSNQDKVAFASRPVIVYVCEDDEHIKEVWDIISDTIKIHPEQEIWFTTDVRVFNYNMAGQRFFEVKSGEMQTINLSDRLRLEEEK